MLHAIVGARVLLAMVVAACVGLWGLHLYPVQTDNPFLGLIQLERPFVFQVAGLRVRDAVVHDAVSCRVARHVPARDHRLSLSADHPGTRVTAVHTA